MAVTISAADAREAERIAEKQRRELAHLLCPGCKFPKAVGDHGKCV